MKFEILAKRIAEKVNYPDLEDALLGRGSITTDQCLVWTGRKTVSGVIPKRVRDSNMRPHVIPSISRPFPRIQYNRKLHYVNRLVYEIVEGPLEGRRLHNSCGNTLCINPNHWLPGKPSTPEAEPEISDELTFEDAEELIEIYLTENEGFDRTHPLLDEIPDDLLREVLQKLNKEHLL